MLTIVRPCTASLLTLDVLACLQFVGCWRLVYMMFNTYGVAQTSLMSFTNIQASTLFRLYVNVVQAPTDGTVSKIED
jgi:hypothetical protein